MSDFLRLLSMHHRFYFLSFRLNSKHSSVLKVFNYIIWIRWYVKELLWLDSLYKRTENARHSFILDWGRHGRYGRKESLLPYLPFFTLASQMLWIVFWMFGILALWELLINYKLFYTMILFLPWKILEFNIFIRGTW